MEKIELMLDDFVLKNSWSNTIKKSIMESFYIIYNCFKNNGTLFVCGNGGSASDAEHITGELMKGFLKERNLCDNEIIKYHIYDNEDINLLKMIQKGCRTICLNSQNSLLTAISNDISYDMIFSQQLFNYFTGKNDVLLALSTSGNSKNIQNALKMGNILGCKNILISGMNSNVFRDTCTIRIPETSNYMIQEKTEMIYHLLCAMIEEKIFR